MAGFKACREGGANDVRGAHRNITPFGQQKPKLFEKMPLQPASPLKTTKRHYSKSLPY